MTVMSLKCSGLHTREITVPNCMGGSNKSCQRIYHFFLPRILCHGGGGRRHRRRRLLLDGSGEDGRNNNSLAYDDIEEVNLIDTASQHQQQQQHEQPQRHTAYDGYFNGEYYTVGTLPMAFLLHGHNEDPHSMMNFMSLADSHHFVLVFPEGLEKSYNAGDCCGYALENGVDDIAFLSQLKAMLLSEFAFLSPDLTFGIGHDNGAFMVTNALEHDPHFFRSVVILSGYTHGIDRIKKGLVGVGVEGGNNEGQQQQQQQQQQHGIGMMIHHALDDDIVRPSGCCDNHHLPKCNGDALSDSCISVLQMFDLWSREINMCEVKGGGHGLESGDEDSYVVSQSGGLEYLLSYQGESTMLSLTPNINDPTTVELLFNSNLPVTVSHNGPDHSTVCLTAASPDCISESTMCVHMTKEHDFGKQFAMTEEVATFLSREACGGTPVVLPGKGGGKSKHVCACHVSSTKDESARDFGGVFCFDALNEDGTYKEKDVTSSEAAVTTGATTSVATSNTTEQPNQEVVGEEAQTTSQNQNEILEKPGPQTNDEAETPSDQTAASVENTPPKQNETLGSQASEVTSQVLPDLPQSALSQINEIPSFNIDETNSEGTISSSLEQSSQEQISSTQGETNESLVKQNDTSFVEPETLESSAEEMKHEQALTNPADSVSLKTQVDTPASFDSNGLDVSEVGTDTSPRGQTNHERMIWVSVLLAFFIALGLVWGRRRMRKKNRAKEEELDMIAHYHDDVTSIGSPYRDFFQKGNNHAAVEEDNSRSGYDDEEGDDPTRGNSEHDEHCPPYRMTGETELVNRGRNDDKILTSKEIDGGLDTIQKETHRLLSRFDLEIEAEMTKQQIMDDYCINTRNDDGLDDSTSERSYRSHVTLPESLLHVVNSNGTYLDPQDRKLLQRYRKGGKQGSDSVIIGRKSEDMEDDEVVMRDSFQEPNGGVDFMEDLEHIESQIV